MSMFLYLECIEMGWKKGLFKVEECLMVMESKDKFGF